MLELKEFLLLQGINKVKDIKLTNGGVFDKGTIIKTLNSEPGRVEPEPFNAGNIIIWENDGTSIGNLIDENSGNFGYTHVSAIVPKDSGGGVQLIHAWTSAESTFDMLSDWPKVRLDPIDHSMLTNRRHVQIKLSLSEYQLPLFYAYLFSRIGNLYDFAELLGAYDDVPDAIIDFLDSNSADICSALVASALRASGYDMKEAGLQDFVTPNDFATAFGARKGRL